MNMAQNQSPSLAVSLFRFGILVLLLAVFFFIYTQYDRFYVAREKTETKELEIRNTKNQSEPQKNTPPRPIQITLSTTFFGDVFWGRYVDDWSMASELKYAYPFSGLNSFEKTQYDAWIADLECPITSTYLDSKTQDSTLSFSCKEEYTVEAAKWFTAFTLANNHTNNMEKVNGLQQTRTALDTHGIQYFGHFDSTQNTDTCEVVSLPAKIVYQESTELGALPVALCGLHNVFKLPTEQDIAVIGEYAKYFPTIVMPHQGSEYTYSADGLQQAYSRRYIDLGADAVIGGHVHSVQNTESYKKKLIVYSMGNFIFDQQFSPQVREGVAPNIVFTFPYTENLAKYAELGASCKQFKDACLAKAKKQLLTKPDFTMQYDFIPTDNSGKLAKKGTPELKTKLKKIMNWDETLKGLK
jgi:hypothetical protein